MATALAAAECQRQTRRLRLLAGNPRELIVPLATPVLFAIVIGPALTQGGTSPNKENVKGDVMAFDTMPMASRA